MLSGLLLRHIKEFGYDPLYFELLNKLRSVAKTYYSVGVHTNEP